MHALDLVNIAHLHPRDLGGDQRVAVDVSVLGDGLGLRRGHGRSGGGRWGTEEIDADAGASAHGDFAGLLDGLAVHHPAGLDLVMEFRADRQGRRGKEAFGPFCLVGLPSKKTSASAGTTTTTIAGWAASWPSPLAVVAITVKAARHQQRHMENPSHFLSSHGYLLNNGGGHGFCESAKHAVLDSRENPNNRLPIANHSRAAKLVSVATTVRLAMLRGLVVGRIGYADRGCASVGCHVHRSVNM